MLGQSFKIKILYRKRFALILIIIGLLFTVSGIILFQVNNGSSYESEIHDGREESKEESNTMEQETTSSPDSVESSELLPSDEARTVEKLPSTEDSKEGTENITLPLELDYFTGEVSNFESYTFMMLDRSVQQEGQVPNFHTVSAISTKVGVNAKTNEDSSNLHIFLSALPDREMSISVLVSEDYPEISGTTPDFIQGLQWILTYSGGEFKKKERLVEGDGKITQLAAENFNIRFIGNEATAEVEFFGPLGTQYYAVMIYDDTYCTLILP